MMKLTGMGYKVLIQILTLRKIALLKNRGGHIHLKKARQGEMPVDCKNKIIIYAKITHSEKAKHIKNQKRVI